MKDSSALTEFYNSIVDNFRPDWPGFGRLLKVSPEANERRSIKLDPACFHTPRDKQAIGFGAVPRDLIDIEVFG